MQTEFYRTQIVYDHHSSQSEDGSILFLPGMAAGCDLYMHQLHHFERTFSTLCLDPRNLGITSVESYATTISKWLKDLETPRLLAIVGHSLGGLVALEIAKSYPTVRSLILLDTPLLIPDSVKKRIIPFQQGLATGDYRKALIKFANTFFFSKWDSRETRERFLEQLLHFPKDSYLSLSQSVTQFDSESALSSWRAPLLFIHSSVPTDLSRLAQIAPGVQIGRTVCAGHYAVYETPEQINAMISRFLKSTLDSTDQRQDRLILKTNP